MISISFAPICASSSFEKKYDPIPVLNWMRERPMVPVAAVAFYGAFIVFGQLAMRNREAWNWRRTMALWNLGLSVFSWIGMSRTLPHLLHNFSTMSVHDNFCSDPQSSYGGGSTGLWVQLFILSKFPYVAHIWLLRCQLCFREEFSNACYLFLLFPFLTITVNSLILFSL